MLRNRPFPSQQEKSAALEEVLSSETFARSEQLRAFLQFVCEMESSNRAAEITEYLIGVKALGRPENFSPQDDSSVRTRAYELRQRLQRYYTVEKPDAAVHIELPKGSYAPRFVVGAAPVAVPTEPAGPQVSEGRARRFIPILTYVGVFLAGVLVASLVAVILVGRMNHLGIDPALKDAWTPIVSKDAEVVISVGAPLHLLVTPYLGAVREDSYAYPAPKEAYELFARYRILPKDAKLEMQPVQTAASVGNLESVVKVTSLLQAMHEPFRILPETNSPLAALRQRSAILFASPWYSQSASILLEKTPWTTQWDGDTRQVGLFHGGTHPDRKLEPRRGPRGEYQEVFGLVSVLPNDNTADGGRSIVVFSGLTSVGTHGAAAFFTSGSDLTELAQRFRKEGLSRWPRSFQVVVRCRASSDAQLLSYSYETHEVLSR